VNVAQLDLDLDVFAGPFDLLMAVVLRRDIDLLEVDLAEVVLAYLDHLDREGELDLESATEFLVLIAALLELKSRLMLPDESDDELELGQEEAAEELLARLLEYTRYRGAAESLVDRLGDAQGFLYRSAPLPPDLRRVSLELASQAYQAQSLAEAIGDLLAEPVAPDVSHIRQTVSLERRLRALRAVLDRRQSFDFDEVFGDEDRLTQAVTLFALLEMHRRGEATWRQKETFGSIEITKATPLAVVQEAPADG
jgi:segregation and condensation protein A